MHPHLWYKDVLQIDGPRRQVWTSTVSPIVEKQMDLRSLCPAQGVDLSRWRAHFDKREWSAWLPPALPESFLLPLASDFRRVEVSNATGNKSSEEDASSLALAIYIVMGVITRHPNRSSSFNDLVVSEDGLLRAIKFYQIGLEREIVTRITGLAAAFPPDLLAISVLTSFEQP